MVISTLIAGTCLRKVGPSVFCIVFQNSEVLGRKVSSCWDWTVVALLSDGGFELPNSPGSVLLHFSYHVVPKFSTLSTLNELWSRENVLFIIKGNLLFRYYLLSGRMPSFKTKQKTPP